MEGLDGTWQMVGAELSGEAAPELVIEQSTMQLAAEHYTMRFGGEAVDCGTFELGGVVEAQTILLHGVTGPNAGRTIPCLYQLRGNRLRICFGLDGVAPTDFITQPQTRRYLAMYRRESPPLR